MKTRIFTAIALLFILSCKKEAKKESIKSESVKAPNQLVLKASIKFSKTDKFKLFAGEVFLNNNQNMNISIIQELKSNTDFQELTFIFPENIKPDYQLGLSFGSKKEKEIELKDMVLSYGDAQFKITPETLSDYLVLNKFISVDPDTKKITTSKVDNKHNPIMFFRRKVLDSIQNVF